MVTKKNETAPLETMIGSAQEIADMMGVDYGTANAFVKLLVLRGIATAEGVRPNKTGKGKGSNLFKIPTGTITVRVCKG